MRHQVLREISKDLKQGREGAKDEGMDTYDLASEERDRASSSTLTTSTIIALTGSDFCLHLAKPIYNQLFFKGGI